jgi:hypothetical protein
MKIQKCICGKNVDYDDCSFSLLGQSQCSKECHEKYIRIETRKILEKEAYETGNGILLWIHDNFGVNNVNRI